MSTAEGGGGSALPSKFDAPSAIIANVLAHIVTVVPLALYVMAAPALMKAFDVGQASIGVMLSIGLACSSVTALAVGSNAYRLNLRTTAMLGMLVHISGNVVALLAGVWEGILLARGMSAVGDAMLLSSANAVLARSSKNTRNWAICSVATGLSTSIGTFALGQTLDEFGPDIFFGAMIVLGLLILPTLWFLPTHTLPEAERGKRKGGFVANLRAAMGSAKGLAILIGIMLLGLANNSIFGFSTIIGSQIGLSTAQFGTVQSMAYIGGTTANLIIIFVAARFGQARPLMLLGAILALSALLLGTASSYLLYAIAVVGMATAYRGTNPYVYGTAARHDPSGGVAASLVVFIGIGGTIGPMLTGFILGNSQDYTPIGFLAAALFACGAALLVWVALSQERAGRAQAASPIG